MLILFTLLPIKIGLGLDWMVKIVFIKNCGKIKEGNHKTEHILYIEE